jgi:hypothetical protein
LDTYKKWTKKDLLAHPLTAGLQTCNSPGAIIALLQEQVQGLDQSRSSDERWSKWLDPIVNVLQAFSSILEAGATLVCLRTYLFESWTLRFILQAFPPANVIFAGVGVLLSVSIFNNFPSGRCNVYFSQTVKVIRASKDTLIDIFERMETFFRRVEVYTEAQSTPGMMDIIIRIIVEVLSILGIATKEIKQSRLSRYLLYKYITVD